MRVIEDKVAKVKSNKEWRREYMTLLMREQEIREEGIEVGIRASVKMLKSLHIPEQTMIEQLVEQFPLAILLQK